MSVSALEVLEVATLLGEVKGDHSHGLQQPDPCAGWVVCGTDEGGVEEAGHRSECGPEVQDLGERVEGAARGTEDGEGTKGLLLGLRDHPVAPLDGGPQGLLPLRMAGQG